jgi:hypothetical protein
MGMEVKAESPDDFPERSSFPPKPR